MEKLVIKPSVKVFAGLTVKKDSVLEYSNEYVKQTLKDLVLTTEIERENNYQGLKTTETSKIVTELKEGMRLVMSEEEGYVISPYKMATIEEAIKDLEQIKEIYKEE